MRHGDLEAATLLESPPLCQSPRNLPLGLPETPQATSLGLSWKTLVKNHVP